MILLAIYAGVAWLLSLVFSDLRETNADKYAFLFTIFWPISVFSCLWKNSRKWWNNKLTPTELYGIYGVMLKELQKQENDRIGKSDI